MATDRSSPRPTTLRRTLIEWGVILAVFGGLYVTGLHVEVVGRLQQVMLWTGLYAPDLSMPPERQVPAEYDLMLRTLDGEPFSLREVEGQAVFLNFWASWCPPCVAEMPAIHRLYEALDGENVAFVMVTQDDDLGAARDFVASRDFTFPVYTLAGRLPDLYRSPAIPTTFILSPDGRLVVREEGMAKYDSRAFIAFMRRLARESPGGP